MAKLTTEELIEQFKELTLIELSEFVKAFEETFDVTAAAPAAVAVAAAPGAASMSSGSGWRSAVGSETGWCLCRRTRREIGNVLSLRELRCPADD